ncbi:MAG: DUF1947 domain-containing protein [Candidatus Hodarchaeota archaeon]
MKVRKRHLLSSKDLRRLRESLLGLSFHTELLVPKGAKVELIHLEDMDLYAINDRIHLVRNREMIFPALHALLEGRVKLPHVVVDTGAVPYVARGAAIMAPGIVETDKGIEIGDIVVIVDEIHKRPLAIGIALMSAIEIKTSKRGRAVDNLHHVGDTIWGFIKTFQKKGGKI